MKNQISEAHVAAAYEMGSFAEKAFNAGDFVTAARLHRQAATLWEQSGIPNAGIQEAAARTADQLAAIHAK